MLLATSAFRVHVPVVTIVTLKVPGATVQTAVVVEVSTTVWPEAVVVGATVRTPDVIVRFAIAPKVMVCESCAIVTFATADVTAV